MKFDREYFKQFTFTDIDIKRYLENAYHDFKIAEKDQFSEVKFTYAYQALIKTGIAVLAKVGRVKVRSVPGHHVKILEKMSVILRNEDISVIGNAMRMKRNTDLCGGGALIGEKEAADYLKFVQKVIKAANDIIN